MPIEFKCLNCGEIVSADDDAAGTKVDCPACDFSATVPNPIGGTLTSKRMKSGTGSLEQHRSRKSRPQRQSRSGSPVVSAGTTPNKRKKTQRQPPMRSENFLVIERESTVFPDYCVRCNQPEVTERTPINFVDVHRRTRTPDHLSRVERSVTLSLPVCDRCQESKTRLAKRFNMTGIVLLGVSGILWIWIFSTSLPQTHSIVFKALVCAGVTFVCGLASVVIAFGIRNHDQDSPAQHIDDQYVWIVGFHKKFLDQCPPWTGPKFRKMLEEKYGR